MVLSQIFKPCKKNPAKLRNSDKEISKQLDFKDKVSCL